MIVMGVPLCWPLLGPVPLVPFVQHQAFETPVRTDVRGRSDPSRDPKTDFMQEPH